MSLHQLIGNLSRMTLTDPKVLYFIAQAGIFPLQAELVAMLPSTHPWRFAWRSEFHFDTITEYRALYKEEL